MKLLASFCDLCFADNEFTLAAGKYTTNEGKTYHACEDHLTECKGYGFTTKLFEVAGDVSQ